MNGFEMYLRKISGVILLGIVCAASMTTHAHFMVAQRGTLNFVDDGVFMVLSLPMSAFELDDADNNGAISMIEFNNQRALIVGKVREHVLLTDDLGSRELLGLMLSPELAHDSENEHVSQVIVMGKYSISELAGELSFQANLFGEIPSEQELIITAKRKPEEIEQEFKLTALRTTKVLNSELTANQRKSQEIVSL